MRDRLVVEHPLQPFDIRNVIPGRLGMPRRHAVHVRPDRAAGGRARALASARNSRHSSRARCRRSLPDDVVLADLVAFFKDPVKGFFRALDYTLPWDVDGVEDAMPVDIDALEEWTVGDRMLQRHAARHDTRRGAPGGVAARHAAAGSAGLAQGHRDQASRPPCSPPPRYDTAAQIRRRTTSTSTWVRAGD